MNSVIQQPDNQLVRSWIETRVPFLQDVCVKHVHAPYKNQKAYDELLLILRNYPTPLEQLPLEMIPLLNAIGDPQKSWRENVAPFTKQPYLIVTNPPREVDVYDTEVIEIFTFARERAQKSLTSALEHTNEMLYGGITSTIKMLCRVINTSEESEKCENTYLRKIAFLINELQKQILLNKEYDPNHYVSRSYELLVQYFAKQGANSTNTQQKIVQLLNHLFTYYNILFKDEANNVLNILISQHIYSSLMDRKKEDDFWTALDKADIPDAVKKAFLSKMKKP